jgi:phasin family protein
MASERAVWSDMGTQFFSNLKGLGEINYTLMNRLAQQQMEMMSICLESNVKHLQVLSEAQDVKGLLNSEASLVDEAGKKVLSNVQGTMEVLEGTKAQWLEWADNSLTNLQKAA